MAAILATCEGQSRSAHVCGPLGQPVPACWGWLPQTRTAIIEMAEASGLQLLTLEQRDACVSSSYGTGQLILEALEAGAKEITLTTGGSATNDGGVGMLEALGARFVDAQGSALDPGGLALLALEQIDLSDLDPRLQTASFVVAADVDDL